MSAHPQAQRIALFLTAAAGLQSAGCLPLPFASPPIAATIGAAAPAGTVLKPRRDGPSPTTPEFVMAVRAGANPLQLSEKFFARDFDFGVGYLFELIEPAEGLTFFHHGGYLEGSWVFLTSDPFRLQLTGSAEVLFSRMAASDAIAVGVGGTAQISAELMTWASEPVESVSGAGGFIGWVHGEIGVGLYLAFSARYFVNHAYFYGAAGVRIRFPAAAGVVIVPLIGS